MTTTKLSEIKSIKIGTNATDSCNNIAIGKCSNTSGNGIVIGEHSASCNGISIGHGAGNICYGGIAIGSAAGTNNSITIGNCSVVSGERSIVIGHHLSLGEHDIVVVGFCGCTLDIRDGDIAIGGCSTAGRLLLNGKEFAAYCGGTGKWNICTTNVTM